MQIDPLSRFVRYAVLSSAVYVAVAVVVSRAPEPGQQDVGNWPLAMQLTLWFAVAALIALYFWGWRVVEQDAVPASTVLVMVAVQAAAAFTIPPFHSQDVLSYASLGWAQHHYGLNTYLLSIDTIPGWKQDPMLPDHIWASTLYPYGFTFARFAKLIAALGGGSLDRTLLLFKVAMACVHVGVTAIAWRTARVLGTRRPERVAFAIGSSPLLLVHAVGHAHNDLLGSGAVLLAIFLLAQGARTAGVLAIPAYVCGAFVKYAPGPAFPLLAVRYVHEKRWKDLAIGGALAVALLIVLAWPYLGSARVIDPRRVLDTQTNAFHGSLLSFLPPLVRAFDSTDPMRTVHAIMRGVLCAYLLWVAGYAFVLWRRRADLRTLVRAIALTQLVLVMCVSRWFWPWHIGMFLPIALVLDEEDVVRRLAFLFSVTHLLELTSVQLHQTWIAYPLTAVPALVVLIPHFYRRFA